MATIIIDNSSYVFHRDDEHIEIQNGDYLTEALHSDTRVWEVIKTTNKTITVRLCKKGETIHREDRNGNGWPQDYSEALPDENGTVKTLRERKRRNGKAGFYSFDGRRATHPTRLIDGKPVFLTDYRY